MNRIFRHIHSLVFRHPIRLISFVLLIGGLVFAAYGYWSFHQIALGWNSLDRDALDQAEKHFRNAQPLHDVNPDLHRGLARLYRLRGDLEAAEREIKRTNELRGEPNESDQLEWILLRATRGEMADVEAGLWNCILNDHPQKFHLLETMANIHLRDRRLNEALQVLEYWIEQQPAAKAHHRKGWILDSLNRGEDALREYRRALELDPEREEVRIQLIDLLLHQNKIEETVPHLEWFQSHPSERREVLHATAYVWQKLGRVEDAAKAAEELMIRFPDFAEAYLLRGKLELQQESIANAVNYLKKAVDLDPGNAEAHYNLFLALNNDSQAETDAKYHLERSQQLQKDSLRASDIIRKEIPKQSNRIELYLELGELYFRLHQPAEAIRWLHNGLGIRSDYRPIHQLLFNHYQKIGNSEQAERHEKYLSK